MIMKTFSPKLYDAVKLFSQITIINFAEKPYHYKADP